MDLEITKLLTVSTAHIPAQTRLDLLNDVAELPTHMAYEYGWYFVDIDSYVDNIVEYSQDYPELAAVLDLAHEHGCGMVRFDADGPVLDGFPTFDW